MNAIGARKIPSLRELSTGRIFYNHRLKSRLRLFLERLIRLAAILWLVLVFFTTSVFAQTSSIKIGIYNNKPKVFIDENGRPAGLFPEILNYISSKEKWATEYLACDWDDCLKMLNSGSLDIMVDVAYTKEREEKFDFNQQLVLSNWSRVYAKQDHNFIQSILDLDKKKIAVLKGSFQLQKLKDDAKKYAINPVFVVVDNYHQVFKLVENNKVDAGIVNRLFGAQQENNYAVYPTNVILYPSSLHFATSKGKHSELLASIDSQLKLLKSDKKSMYYKAIEEVFRATKKIVSPKISLNATERTWLESHPVIRIGVDADYAPYSFLDIGGTYQGVAPDFLAQISDILGIRFEIVAGLSWSEIIEGAKNRSLDAIATAVRTPERETYLNFTGIYIPTPLVIMTRNNDDRFNVAGDLSGKKVALVKGYSSTRKVMNELPAIELYQVDTVLDGLRAVATGKADAYVGVLGVSVFQASKNGIHNLKVAAPFEMKSNGQRFALRNDWPELASLMTKAINAIPQSERIQILNKWVPVNVLNKPSQLLDLTDRELQWLSDHKSIRLAIDPEFAPVEFIDDQGNYSGISADYVKLLSQRLGIAMHVIPGLSWTQAIQQAKKGNIDVFAAITPTADRKKYLNFSRPYFKYPFVIYTRDDYPVISGLESLSQKKVTVVRDYVTHELIKSNYSNVKLFTADTIYDGLSSVSTGRADAFVGDIATSTYIIRKHNLTNLKIAAPTEFKSKGHAFAVRKEWPELVSIINKTLKTIPPEKHLEFSRKWIDIEVEQLHRYWTWVAISAAGLMLIFFVTSSLLRIQVSRKTSELSFKNELLLTENIDRQRAESKLSESEKRLSQFFHATFEMVFFHENGIVVDVNPAVTKMTGYTTEEIVGNNMLEFVASDSRLIVANNMSEGIEDPYEANIITKTGSLMPVEVHASNIKLKDHLVRVVSLRDITERKRNEAVLEQAYGELELKVEERTSELRLANIKLKELDQLKSMFIASVSHELRTPLNSIIGFSSLMKQDAHGELGEKYKDYVDRINNSGKHLLSLITDIIDISKIESGRIDVEQSDFESDEVVLEAVDNLNRQAERKGLTIIIDDIPQSVTLHTDKRRLFQCILNYLSNAIKYTEQGKITLSTEDQADNILFVVRDEGIGVCEEDMSRLFEAFERFDTHLRVKAGGTGLGLYLTKKIATDLLQGEVGADSKSGVGSTFWIRIPKVLKS